MKTTSTAPTWAVELVVEVCAAYKRRTPDLLQWYATKEKYSSGHASYSGKKIHISAGTDEHEQRVVLLHELAHHILAKRGRQGHSKRFWELFIELNIKHGDIKKAYWRDVEMATKFRPGTRVKAIEAFAAQGFAL